MPFGIVILILALAGMAFGFFETLLKHQRKMEEIHRGRDGDARIAALEAKVEELTALVHEQAIALDGYPRAMMEERLHERIGRS